MRRLGHGAPFLIARESTSYAEASLRAALGYVCIRLLARQWRGIVACSLVASFRGSGTVGGSLWGESADTRSPPEHVTLDTGGAVHGGRVDYPGDRRLPRIPAT